MARQITASVGRMGGINRPQDVKTVQELLNQVPPTSGGPKPPLIVDRSCGQKTIKAIQTFQLHHFGWKGADGRVDPNGQTLAKLNEFDGRKSNPSFPPPLTTGSLLICPHGGQVQSVPRFGQRIPLPHLGNLPLYADTASVVTGCPFVRGGGRPSPCIRVQWMAASREPLSENSIGNCYNAENIPQGRVRVICV